MTPTTSVTPTITPTTSLTPTLTSTPTPTPTPSQILGFNVGEGFERTGEVIISDGSGGYIILGPNFYKSTFRNQIFQLNQYAQLQSGYQNSSFNNFNNQMYQALLDGTDLVIGLNGNLPSASGRQFLVKIDNTGAPVSGWTGSSTQPNNPVQSIGKFSTGDYLAAGSFTTIGGITSNRLARLSPSNSAGNSTFATNIGTGPNTASYAQYIFSDDTFLHGGGFTTFNGTGPARLIKLNYDGTRVTSFNNEVLNKFTTGAVFSIDYDVTGDTIYVAGSFTYVTGATTYTRVVALNGDGSLKSSFVSSSGGFNGNVFNIKWDSVTNRLYCMGAFTSYKGSSLGGSQFFCRLDASGNLDTTYQTTMGDGFASNPASTIFNGYGQQIVIDPNGDVVLVGGFTNFDPNVSGPGINFNRIIKFDKNGNLLASI
jgi:hypothetical protein